MNHFKKSNNKLEKSRGIFFQIGLIIAGGLTLVAFEWMTPINPYALPVLGYEIEGDEWDLPPIIPEDEVIKPKVKTTPVQQTTLFTPVKKLVEPTPEPSPEPTPDPTFDPDKWSTPTSPDPVEDAPFRIVEKMPEFVGGVAKMKAFLGKHLSYPKMDKEAGVEGTVYLQFVVNKKGEIKDVEILRGVSPLIDKEALRVVSSMPNWTPGKQRGKTVSVMYNLPISFRLK